MAIASEVKKKTSKTIFFSRYTGTEGDGTWVRDGTLRKKLSRSSGLVGSTSKVVWDVSRVLSCGSRKKNKYRWQFKVRVNNRMSSS